MNDPVLAELKVIVERTVRPVRASRPRKRRMREELLDHLAAIYEEEFQRAGDTELAVQRAKQRFGDPQDLTAALRASVSRLDCAARVLDLDRARPGESLLHLAVRHFLASGVCMTGALLLVLPLIWLRGRTGETTLFLRISLVVYFFSAAFSFSFAFLVGQMGQTLYGRRCERPARALILYCLASLAVFPVLTSLTYLGLFGNVSAGLSGFLMGWIVAPTAPLLLLILARQMRVEIEHESQWADIEIEE